jgi:hypothetical protein
MKMTNMINNRIPSTVVQRRYSRRRCEGQALAECMAAVTIGSVMLYAIFSATSLFYTTITTSENQIIATNMAQQVIDNARNSTYPNLNSLVNGSQTSTALNAVSQRLDLFGYTSTLFPRPLLQNRQATTTGSGPAFQATYSTAAQNHAFPASGTVTETLTTLDAYDSVNLSGAMQVNVVVAWTESRGKHSYSISTLISQSGIHNY